MGILDVPAVPRSAINEMITLGISPVAARLGDLPLSQTQKILGPVTSDMPTITLAAATDPAWNVQYLITGGVTAPDWPVDIGPGPSVVVSDLNFSNPGDNVRSYRIGMDGTTLVWQTFSPNAPAGVHGFLAYVDGAPVSLTPTAYSSNLTNNKMVFATAKPRLIEILSESPIGDVKTIAPYRLWKPPPASGLRVLVVGDSYAQGRTHTTSQTLYTLGAYATLGHWLGTDNYWTDAYPGTGYLATNAPGVKYRDRAAAHIAGDPDIVIVHGGGANDLLGGFTVNQIVAEAQTYFTALRAGLPRARLVFVEGFSPPAFPYDSQYVQIRQALQTSLTSVGVYYIDVATSSDWLSGTGYIGNTTGSGNSDIYIGNDGTHFSPAGAQYLLARLAYKYRAVLADDGSLVNTLI